jgi:hypothetical protein
VREKCPEGEIKVNARDHVIDFGIEYIKKRTVLLLVSDIISAYVNVFMILFYRASKFQVPPRAVVRPGNPWPITAMQLTSCTLAGMMEPTQRRRSSIEYCYKTMKSKSCIY